MGPDFKIPNFQKKLLSFLKISVRKIMLPVFGILPYMGSFIVKYQPRKFSGVTASEVSVYGLGFLKSKITSQNSQAKKYSQSGILEFRSYGVVYFFLWSIVSCLCFCLPLWFFSTVVVFRA